MTGETTTTTLTANVRVAYNKGAYHAFEANGQFWKSAVSKESAMESGSGAVFDKWNALTVATAALNELTDGTAEAPTITQTTISPVEHGKWVQTSKKWRLTAYGENERLIAEKLGMNANASLDTLAREALDAQTGATWIIYAGTTSYVTSIVKTDELTTDDFRAARAMLEANDVPPFGDNFYRAYIHPSVLKDLKDETGITGWTYKAAYSNEMNKAIAINGEEGTFEGFRVIRSSRCQVQSKAGNGSTTTAASADVYTTYFLGDKALAEAHYGAVPQIKVSQVMQNSGDAYGRKQFAAWYALVTYAALEDDSLIKAYSSSSMAVYGG